MKTICALIGACILLLAPDARSQNVGIGTTSPAGKLHVKGGANISQLVIDAHSTQGNTQPLIKLRSSSGSTLMWIHSDNPSNTFVGLNAGRVNFIDGQGGGLTNTFIGSSAGYSNTTGSWNTALGVEALYSTTTGYYNTAHGAFALKYNTTGHSNTATGLNALAFNTYGYSNTAIGRDALYSNSSGYFNTANGHGALFFNTTGYSNTGIGTYALYSNTTGAGNSAIGVYTLYHNTGSSNCAMGNNALFNNTTGYYNIAIGASALNQNTTGIANTALGLEALENNSGGGYNTAIGFLAGINYGVTSSNFTSLGNNAGHVASNSNEMELGNTSVSWIGGQSGFFNYSDQRIKDNIQSNVPGLSFVNQLNPVTYQLNIHRQNDICGIPDTVQWEGKYDIEHITQTGFIAQEVEQAALASNYNFSGVRPPAGNGKLYSLQYASFVVPLVKAVQELSEENTMLKAEVANIKLVNEALILRMEKFESYLAKER